MAQRLLLAGRMNIENLDRNAAFVAARTAQVAIRAATATWPPDVARCANKLASDTVAAVVESLTHAPRSAARRKSLRGALCSALDLAGICDIAISHGFGSAAIEDSLRCTSRTLSMLGMSFHATATGID